MLFNLSRLMCLQRYVLNECRCLDGSIDLPFSIYNHYNQPGLWCGLIKQTDAVAFPEKHNVTHCLNASNLMSQPECLKVFGKMFHDLQCLERVKKQFIQMQGQRAKEVCNCPEACDSYAFETYYSLASWPSEGPDLDDAYQQLVLDKMVDDFNSTGFNNTNNGRTDTDLYWDVDYNGNIFKDPWVSRKIISYLTNPDNKREILKDFTRLTVYMKDLTVETTEDLADYPWESLLSDIGR